MLRRVCLNLVRYHNTKSLPGCQGIFLLDDMLHYQEGIIDCMIDYIVYMYMIWCHSNTGYSANYTILGTLLNHIYRVRTANSGDATKGDTSIDEPSYHNELLSLST